MTYPATPGYARDSFTSRDAATAVLPKMRPLHVAIIGVLRRFGPLTADEIATHVGRHILTIRPRLTELRLDGFVERTTDTRPSALGNDQHVMRLTDRGQHALQNCTDTLETHSPTIADCASDGPQLLLEDLR